MKNLFLILMLCSSNAFSECISGQLDLRPDIKFIEGTPIPNDMHLPMGNVKIELPAKHLSMDLQSLRITKGEVAEFYIPLVFKVHNGLAQASLIGYRDSLKNFALEVRYSNSTCTQSLQTMLLYGN